MIPEFVESQTVILKVEFWFGIKGIAKALELHEKTIQRLLREGKLPAKKDGSGRWVLANIDYYQILV